MQEHIPSTPPRGPSPRANPFGHVDHSGLGGFGADLVYGLRPDGTHAHISAVPGGLACGCICPACERTVVARKGTQKAHHFAHYGTGNGCGRGAETNAHIWAKEVLGREKRIMLPAVAAQQGRERLQLHAPRMFSFIKAHLEKALGDIVPDVILTTRDGRRLLVEVLVTHRCGPDKIEKLRAGSLPTVEVDLGAWRTSGDRAAIEKALIESAPREWLHNDKKDLAAQKLQAQIAAREEQERRRRQRAAAARQRELDQKVRRLLDADQACSSSKVSAGLQEYRILHAQRITDALNPGIMGIGFLVPSDWWQAAIYRRYVSVPYAGRFDLPHFTVEEIATGIDDCIHPAFHEPPPDDVRATLRATRRDAVLPHEAIDGYLNALCMAGYLQASGLGGYEFSDDQAEAIERDHQRRQAVDRRQATVTRVMEVILAAITPEELWDFDVETWQRSTLPRFRRPVALIIEEGGDRWTHLSAALSAIEAMIAGGPLVVETLGLPLGGVVARSAAAIRSKAVEAADRRAATLRNCAEALLGNDAEDWLHGTEIAAARLARAEATEAGLEAALAEVEQAAQQRTARLRAEAKTLEVRETLRTAVAAGLGTTLGAHFLRNHDPGLGAAPGDYCVDDHTLFECLQTLRKWQLRGQAPRRRGR
ncbi:MAG: hypothetical protein JWR80_872 [Bradyrhizobium sp.]|nr:hypothetical protein [Bradyrhizobium sp.]